MTDCALNITDPCWTIPQPALFRVRWDNEGHYTDMCPDCYLRRLQCELRCNAETDAPDSETT